MNTDELIQLCFGRPHAWALDDALEVRLNDDTLSHVETGVRTVLVQDLPVQMVQIAWVSTDPAYRGLKLASGLIEAAHEYGRRAGVPFAGLFADIPRFYNHLGYFHAPNLGEWGMVKQLGTAHWPLSLPVDLQGPLW